MISGIEHRLLYPYYEPLLQEWLTLWEECHAPADDRSLWKRWFIPSPAEQIFQEIYQRYSEPHRRYHSPKHIAHVLNELKEVEHGAQRSRELKLAAFMHDKVYDPLAQDNEEKSAAESKDIAFKMEQSIDFADYTGSLICSTKIGSVLETIDEKIMHDCDYAIMGRSHREYRAYCRGIRFEYRRVPQEIFIPKRSKFLGDLNQQQIYLTDHFVAKYEKTAHENIEWEIQELEKGMRKKAQFKM